MKNKIISLNIRTDGEPIAICGISNGEIDYSRVGLIALPVGPARTYQLNCYGVQAFSERAIEHDCYLERAVQELLESDFRTGRTDALHRGRGLKVYFGKQYAGLISFGRKFDMRTIWDESKREIVDVEHLGLGLERYSPEVRCYFLKLAEYLDERNRKERDRVRRAA